MGLPGIEIIVAQRGGGRGGGRGEKSAKGESCGEGGNITRGIASIEMCGREHKCISGFKYLERFTA